MNSGDLQVLVAVGYSGAKLLASLIFSMSDDDERK
jgi:hypothetical protein